MPPKFAKGQDEGKLGGELTALLESGWKLDEEQRGVEKTYYLKTYTKVLDLHNSIGIRCKSKNHHPRMTSEFGSLTVYWTTHKPPGISANDTFMAEYCDEQAKMIGTVDQNSAQKCGPVAPPQI